MTLLMGGGREASVWRRQLSQEPSHQAEHAQAEPPSAGGGPSRTREVRDGPEALHIHPAPRSSSEDHTLSTRPEPEFPTGGFISPLSTV